MKKLELAPQDNIVNQDKWTTAQHLSYFQERLASMKTKRSPFEAWFKEDEARETAVPVYDNYGELLMVVPLEQIMTEIYLWRTNGKIIYDIIPDWQATAQELEPAKYTVGFFLDWNNKDNFWKENKSFRTGKCNYGTGIFFTGMRSYKDVRHVVKEDVELQGGTDLLNENNFDEVINETWMFFPKNVHVMDFYLDDAAIGNPDIQYAEDCIMKEKVSFKEFELMFWDNNAIDKEVYRTITTGTDDSEKNIHSQSIHQEEIVLYYYFNRVTKSYYIVANEDKMLYQGIYLYDDGKLPFTSAQHFPNDNCFYGRSMPHRIMALKVYIGEILQDMISGASMANSINLLTGNEEPVNQDWSFGGRGVNILQTTGWVDQVQRLDTTVNLGYFQSILEILYDLIVQYTGDNPRAPSQAQSDKVGIVEIMEANKAVRQSSIDEGYNICLDEALTMMLARIKQFAPALLSKSIEDKKGKVLKKIFPKIRIDNAEVKKEDGQIVVTDALGKYGYFELKPDVVQWVWVKVQTSSTSSMLPILERERISEMMRIVTELLNVAISSQDAEMIERIKDRYLTDNLFDYVDDAYGFDNGKMKAYTEKDKIDKKAQQMKVEALKKADLALKKLNAQNNQQNTQDMGQGEAPVPQAQGLQPTWEVQQWVIQGATGV